MDSFGTSNVHALFCAVRNSLANNNARVVPFEFEGRRYWIKRAVETKWRWMHDVQRALSSVIPVKLLRFTGDVRGAEALRLEAAIIGRLTARGARVPEIVARTDDWIVLSDLGASMDAQLRAMSDRREAFRLMEAGAWALLRLHRADGWHGNPQSRNLAGSAESIGFIDFEEDVGSRLGVHASQVRDWLLFLCSLQRAEAKWPGVLAELVRGIQGHLPEHVCRALIRLRFFGTPFVVLLKPVARWLGRDIRQALMVWSVLGEVAPEKRRPLRRMVQVGAGVVVLFWLWSDSLH